MGTRDSISLLSMKIRAYNKPTDWKRVDELERICEAGPSGKVSLFTDLLGDPLCRIRNYANYTMLVAESETREEIVGLIRAGLKEVICGIALPEREHGIVGTIPETESVQVPIWTRIAYILGLRVSPMYRRMGVGLRLVKAMEEWCQGQGAEYVYIATEMNNEASINLFTRRLGYMKFRTPSILVQPVYAKPKRLPSSIQIVKLTVEDATQLYRSVFGTREFFPTDIEAILRSKPNKGTWLACYNKAEGDVGGAAAGRKLKEGMSWAVLSVWGLNEIFKLEIRGVAWQIRALAATTRLVGKLLPWVTIPTFPDVFRPFGMQLMYGLHAEGGRGRQALEHLCWHAHNMAKQAGCEAIAAEVACCDPAKRSVPYWKRISCHEDLWCLKRLRRAEEEEGVGHDDDDDWCSRAAVVPAAPIFVDPRDF